MKQQKQDEETIEILTELFDDMQQLQKEEIAKQQKQDEETIEILDKFLPKVSEIRERYAKQEEKYVPRFNVFSILYISSYEEYQHSMFIYSLLNPHAEHRQGAQFLRYFLQTEGLAEFFTEKEITNANVERERFYIDILIRSGSKAIIIENKIGADYGDNQLSRYQQKLIDQGYTKENIKLVYLNLYGSEVPENESDETVRKETIVLSYKYHIIQWLQKCIASVAILPTIHATLLQYTNFVKERTGRPLNEEEIMEMKELFLENPKRIQAFADAQEAFEQATKHIQQKFVIMLANKLREKGYHSLELPDFDDSNDFNFGAECALLSCPGDISISIQIWSGASIIIEKDDAETLSYGFALYKDSEWVEKKEDEQRQKYDPMFREQLGPSPADNEIYVWLKYFAHNKHDILSLARDEAGFIDKCAAEITESVEKLKNSKQFQNGKWLV